MRLTLPEAAQAWHSLAEQLEAMGNVDIPKFNDLLIAVRIATVRAKRNQTT